jgi:iron complex transport system substrate-binding protein
MQKLNVVHSRRVVTGALGGLLLGGAFARSVGAQDAIATPSGVASPQGGSWTYTDVLGKAVTLPARPIRIAANLVTAAALWDLGIQAVAVFDWTASAHPDGDHIAWGNVDPTAVANVGDVDGNILPEELLLADPDVILTLTFDPENPSDTAGVAPDLAGRIEEIAPVLVVTDMASTEVQLERLVALGAALGADLNQADVVEAKATYDAKVAEFREVAASKSDLTAIFMDFDADAIYVAGPKGVAELQFLTSLGLVFANADSLEAGAFWETLSPEAALKYPSDIVYNDVYSTYLTLDDLRSRPVFAAMPAVAAGQVGEWQRDFPVSYAGVTDFLEVILTTLRPAEKVAG